jgi:hypothetical protein
MVNSNVAVPDGLLPETENASIVNSISPNKKYLIPFQ